MSKNNPQYSQILGAIKDDGYKYELHFSQFAALKLSLDPEVKQFRLFNNVKGCGAWDDVVLDITFKDGSCQCYFVQLKQIQNIDKKKLSAETFETSTQVIHFKKLFEDINKVKIFCAEKNINYDNVKFIVYTTADCDEDLEQFKMVSKVEEVSSLMNTNKNNNGKSPVFKLQPDFKKDACRQFLLKNLNNMINEYIKHHKVKKDMMDSFNYLKELMPDWAVNIQQLQNTNILMEQLQKIVEDGLEEFFNKTIYFLNQGTQKDIAEETERLIKREYPCSKEDSVFRTMHKFLENYFGNGLIVNKVDFLLKLLQSISFTRTTNYPRLKFNNESNDRLIEHLQNMDGPFIFCDDTCWDLFHYRLKILVQEYKQTGVLFLNSNELTTEEELGYIKILQDNDPTLLVIISETNIKKRKWLNRLNQFEVKFVAITKEPNLLTSAPSSRQSSPLALANGHHISTSLEDLTEECIKKITERHINFQGYRLLLGCFLDVNHIPKTCINDKHLSTLAKGDKLELGRNLTEFPEKIFFERRFKRETFYVANSEQILNDHSDNIYFLTRLDHFYNYFKNKQLENTELSQLENTELSQLENTELSQLENTELSQLENHKNIFITHSSSDEIKLLLHLKKKFPNKKIHWFFEMNKQMYWKSCPSKPPVELYREDTEVTEDILEINENLNVVYSGPGGGKTTLFQKIAKKWKNKHPENLLIFCTIRNFTKLLKMLNFDQKDDVIYFLSEVFAENANNIRDIIHQFLINSAQVLILIDGIDEVCPKYEQKINKLVQMIVLHFPQCRIFVSSRFNVDLTIVNAKYLLQEFTIKEQSEYLENYIKSKNEYQSINENTIHLKVENLIEIFNSRKNTFDNGVLGIALQLEMTAELCFSRNFTKLKNPSILQLYNMFISQKIKIYLKKNLKIKKCQPLYEKLHKEEKKKIKDKYERLAFYIIDTGDTFRGEYRHSIFTEIEIENIKKHVSSDTVGIVNVMTNGVLEFVHSTIADFLAAKFLYRNWVENLNLIRSRFNKQEFKTVSYFFDLFLVQDLPFLTAIINNDEETVRQNLHLFRENDPAKRNILHISAKYNRTNILEYLLANISDHLSFMNRDSLLYKTPPMYAVKGNIISWHILGIFCKYNVPIDVEQLKTKILDKKEWEKVKKICSKHDLMDMLKLFYDARNSEEN